MKEVSVSDAHFVHPGVEDEVRDELDADIGSKDVKRSEPEEPAVAPGGSRLVDPV
jgi:hypothetical protein